MKARIVTLLAIAALALAACGDDEEATTTAGEITGDTPSDITAAEFIAATDKERILDDFAAENPECEGAIDEGFVLDVSARATELPPEEPMAPEILDACTAE